MDKDEKIEKDRTVRQNRALHLYFKMLAENLNGKGLDMRKVLKPEVDIPWSGTTVKEYLWRPVQMAQLMKESTIDLKTQEIDLIFNTINRHLAKFGVHEPFPSIEEIMRKMQEEEFKKLRFK